MTAQEIQNKYLGEWRRRKSGKIIIMTDVREDENEVLVNHPNGDAYWMMAETLEMYYEKEGSSCPNKGS